METTSEIEKLGDKAATQIKVLTQIARTNGSLLTVEDATSLTDIGESLEKLEHERPRDPQQFSGYRVRGGFVLETVVEGEGREGAQVAEALELRKGAAEYVIAPGNLQRSATEKTQVSLQLAVQHPTFRSLKQMTWTSSASPRKTPSGYF